eukprot:scaffold1014_cov142-Skeletonema_dohrnii-CCMP3373.AAC.18
MSAECGDDVCPMWDPGVRIACPLSGAVTVVSDREKDRESYSSLSFSFLIAIFTPVSSVER